MRSAVFLGFVLLAFAVPSAHAFDKKDVLPDGCGDNKVEFRVDAVSTPTIPPLADGKARIYFLEKYNKPALSFTILTRFGVDGSWMGATRHNSYFFVDVAPGEHKVCGSVKGKRDLVGMMTLNAEAGKTYYWEANYAILFGAVQVTATPHGTSTHRPSHVDTGFDLVDNDEAAFRIKEGDFVTSSERHDQ
jgi:Protein of unknown function (DUF2846)